LTERTQFAFFRDWAKRRNVGSNLSLNQYAYRFKNMSNFYQNKLVSDSRKSRSNIWIIIVGIIGVVCALYFRFNECDKNNELLREKTLTSIHGKVEGKGVDIYNKSFIKLKLQKSYVENKSIWKIIEVGDSIASEKNSPIFTIYRRKAILKIDYREVYKCERYHHIISKKWITL
jgi:hypothetical protein